MRSLNQRRGNMPYKEKNEEVRIRQLRSLAEEIKNWLEKREECKYFREITKSPPFSFNSSRKDDERLPNLKKILVYDMQWRAFRRLPFVDVKRILREFEDVYKKITKKLLPQFYSANTKEEKQMIVNEIYKATIGIKQIGPKIAGVFLRDIVCYLKVWKELTPYLYQPIDRHIRELLTKYLKFFDEKEMPNVSESYFTKKSQNFQKLLAEAYTPRVTFDILYIIGANIHAFYQCDICPLKKSWCKDPYQ